MAMYMALSYLVPLVLNYLEWTYLMHSFMQFLQYLLVDFHLYVESISHYNHIGIEIIAMILMLLGATNFLTHLFIKW